MRTYFSSERIDFIGISEMLIPDYLDMVNDYENVGKFISTRTEKFTQDEEVIFINNKLNCESLIYSMIERDSGEFIGNIELMDVNADGGELGIAITYRKQNKGYGKEAIKRFMEFIFIEKNMKRVFLKAFNTNERAIHVYKECGFIKYNDGISSASDLDNEDIYMELTKTNWCKEKQ